jgi:hypothetical protein
VLTLANDQGPISLSGFPQNALFENLAGELCERAGNPAVQDMAFGQSPTANFGV